MDKKILHKANVERAFVATVMQALHLYISNMIQYCEDNNIKIDSFEKSQLKIIDKGIRNITIEYRSLNEDKSKTFKDYSNILAITIQELFSRTDGNYMDMYKFYNYIKAFPTQNRNIEVPAEIEQKVFECIFKK